MGLSSTRTAGPFKSPATGEAESDFVQTPCATAAHPGFRLEQGPWVAGELLSCPVCKAPHSFPGSSEVRSESFVALAHLQISVSYLEILGG